MFGIAPIGGGDELTDLLTSKPPKKSRKKKGPAPVQISVAKIVESLRSDGRGRGVPVDQLTAYTRVVFDDEVIAALKKNSKVRIDPDFGGYQYCSAIPHVTDRLSLLEELHRRPDKFGRAGAPLDVLSDCYEDAKDDIRDLIRTGQVIALENKVVTEKVYPLLLVPYGFVLVQGQVPSSSHTLHVLCVVMCSPPLLTLRHGILRFILLPRPLPHSRRFFCSQN
jgi:hypothetical protein